MTTSDEKKIPLVDIGRILPAAQRKKELTKTKPQKVILLAGPTACGKTTLSLMLAEKIKGEIISGDSMQVYKGMDIGTAKISQEDQARIPHHLIDIRKVTESFNVVDFYYEARQCIESILARDRVPIVVGGSGFYFRALLYGPPSGPPSMPDLRRALEKEMEHSGSEPMYKKLQEVDPTYALTITSNDKQKIIRALEIVTLTGEKVSKLEWKREKPISDYNFRCWFLYRSKEALYPRIEERCEQMLDSGLIDEVKSLEKQGLRSNTSAREAIGYRQVLNFLETCQSPEEYQKFIATFKRQSRQYAKRQFTWFRKEPLFRWLNVEAHDFEIAVDMIMQDFESAL